MTTDMIERPRRTENARTEQTRAGVGYSPNVDIFERADELTLIADMPGTDPSSIDVSLENGVLTLFGKVQDRQPADTRFALREYGVGDFSRTFSVSEAIDASRISAEYSDGVLTLHLPKAEHAKPRKVAVQAK